MQERKLDTESPELAAELLESKSKKHEHLRTGMSIPLKRLSRSAKIEKVFGNELCDRLAELSRNQDIPKFISFYCIGKGRLRRQLIAHRLKGYGERQIFMFCVVLFSRKMTIKKQGAQIHISSLIKTVRPRWLKNLVILSGETSIGVHGKKYLLLVIGDSSAIP